MDALTIISWNTRSTHNIRKITRWALCGPIAAIALLSAFGCQGLRDGAYEPTLNSTNPSRGTATNANNALAANVTLASPPLSGSFVTSNTNTVVGTTGNGIFAGDFNNDGNQDVLVSNNTSLVYLFHGKGDGTFQPPITVTVAAPTYSMAIADYNLDGYLDFASVANTATSIYVALNDQNVGFNTSIYMTLTESSNFTGFVGISAYSNPSSKYPAIIGAFNYDAKEVGGQLAVTGQTGVASGSTYLQTNGSGALAAAAYDFASNGTIDTIVADQNIVNIWTNSATRLGYNLAQPATMLALGDVDGDGQQDIMVSTSPLSILYYQNSSATFDLAIPENIKGNGTWIVTDDLNKDHRADAIVSTSTGAVVGLGSSARGTMKLEAFNTGHPAAAVAVADFNNDGVVDIAALNSDNGDIAMVLVGAY